MGKDLSFSFSQIYFYIFVRQVNNMYKLIYIVLLQILFVNYLFGQDSIEVINFEVSYGFHTPGGKMASRFENHSSVGGQLSYISKNRSIYYGIESQYLFGTKVKEDVLHLLKNEDGNIIGINSGIAQVVLRQRGLYAGAFIGKIFSFGSLHSKSGIRLQVGPGFFST